MRFTNLTNDDKYKILKTIDINEEFALEFGITAKTMKSWQKKLILADKTTKILPTNILDTKNEQIRFNIVQQLVLIKTEEIGFNSGYSSNSNQGHITKFTNTDFKSSFFYLCNGLESKKEEIDELLKQFKTFSKKHNNEKALIVYEIAYGIANNDLSIFDIIQLLETLKGDYYQSYSSNISLSEVVTLKNFESFKNGIGSGYRYHGIFHDLYDLLNGEETSLLIKLNKKALKVKKRHSDKELLEKNIKVVHNSEKITLSKNEDTLNVFEEESELEDLISKSLDNPDELKMLLFYMVNEIKNLKSEVREIKYRR